MYGDGRIPESPLLTVARPSAYCSASKETTSVCWFLTKMRRSSSVSLPYFQF
jgi:hypothetical protein